MDISARIFIGHHYDLYVISVFKIYVMQAKTITSVFILLFSILSTSSFAQMSSQWYKQNQQAINQHRKGDFKVKVVDASGAQINAEVSYKLVKHAFPWGTAINLGLGSTEDWYRATARAYFNAGVMENSFKWSSMESNQGAVDYGTVNNTLSWADKIGWEMRGHTLLWGSKDYDDFHPLMKWVKDLSIPKQIEACKNRVEREMTYYKGIIKEYDVMNEAIPGHADYLQRTVGDSINWNSFKWARAADPDAKLYINDYNVVSYNDTYKYNNLITKLLQNDAPIDGIGVQCHFGSNLHPSSINSKLNSLSKHNLPIKVTEFDMQVGSSNMSEAKQADYYAQAMRACFAHPNVNGFMFWGFWDSRHWREKAGLFNEDLTPKIAADSVYTLIHDKWSSKGDFTSAQNATNSINVYYGTYEFETILNGKKVVVSALLDKQNSDSIITLDLGEAVLKSPQLISVKAIDNEYMYLYFDDEVEVTRRQHTGFKVYRKSKLTTIGAWQPSDDSTMVKIRLKDKLANNDVVTVFYGANGLYGKNGALIKFAKPLQAEMHIGEFVSAKSTPQGDSIIIQFSEMLDSSSIDNSSLFEVFADGVPILVSGVSKTKMDKDKVVLKLATALKTGQDITVSYVSSKIYTNYGGKVLGFAAKPVSNLVPTQVGDFLEESVLINYNPLLSSIDFQNGTTKPLTYTIYNLNGHLVSTGLVGQGGSKSQYVSRSISSTCVVVVRGHGGFQKVKRFIIK